MLLKNKYTAQNAFTLLELIVAVSIVSIGLVLILRSFILMAQAQASATNRINANKFLQEKMAEIIQLSFEEEGLDETSKEGRVKIDSRRFRWTLEISPLEITEEEQIEEGDDEQEKRLNEVNLTIFWKEANREKEASLATYLPGKAD
jgi:type II secretion system protein I